MTIEGILIVVFIALIVGFSIYKDVTRDRTRCEFCGGAPTCKDCGRCFNRRCNAGCIFCVR